MRHPDFVGVGKEEAHFGFDRGKVFMNAVYFAVYVARRFCNDGKKFFEHGNSLVPYKSISMQNGKKIYHEGHEVHEDKIKSQGFF